METILIMANALAIARNNDEYLDCINDIVNRLPGFIQYTRDKKEGII